MYNKGYLLYRPRFNVSSMCRAVARLVFRSRSVKKGKSMPKFVEGFADKLVVPAGAKDIQVFDDELPGFGIRKFASGATSYFVKFNVGSQQRRKTLGRIVKGNLKPMRLEASKVLAKARLCIQRGGGSGSQSLRVRERRDAGRPGETEIPESTRRRHAREKPYRDYPLPRRHEH